MALLPIKSRRRRNPFRSRRAALVERLESRELLSTYTTPEDTPLTIADAGLAGATVVARPEHGGLTLNNTGGFTYAPNLNFNGGDRFLYTFAPTTSANGALTGDLKEISISVTAVNDPPEAHNDTYPAQQNTQLKVDAPGVLKNDTDVDSDHLTALLVDKPSHGDVTLGDGGGFTYTPAPDFTGLDSFTYRASDGSATSGLATVGINVAPTNPPPQARDDFYSTPQNTALNQPAPGVLGNDTGVNGRPLKATLEHNAEHGSVELKEDGSFTYKPAPDFFGVDKFVYRATDISPLANPLPPWSATATVTIYVRPTAPIVFANNDSYSTTQNTPLGVAAPGVLSNDYALFPPGDPAGTTSNGTPSPIKVPLNATLVTDVSHGKLTLKADGSFQYSPAPDYVGSDTFTYRASLATPTGGVPTAGGIATSDVNYSFPTFLLHDVATVTIYVKPATTPPQAQDDHYATVQETALTIAAPGVLANDRGPDGHQLAAVLVTGTTNADLNLKSDGSFSYAPHTGFTGYDSFTYRAVDTTAPSSTTTDGGRVATVTIFVQPLHPPVYAFDDFYHTPQATTLTVDKPGVLANDRLFPPPLMMSPAGDGESGDPNLPGILPLPFPVTLTATLLTKPAHGSFTLSDNGSFTYTPDPDFTGADTFTYRASATTIMPTPAAGEGEGTIAGSSGIVSGMPCFLNPDGTATCPPQDGTDDVATVTIYVKAPEPPPGPVAQDDNFTTAENTPLGIPAPGVLRNDFIRSPNPQPLALGSVNQPLPPIFPLHAVLASDVSHGKLTLNADGSFKYTPDPDFVGDDKFTYQAQQITPTADGTTTDPITGSTPPILSNIATVTIHVVTALAHNDVYSTPQDKLLKVDAPGVLANDNGGSQAHPLTATLVSDALHGKLTLNTDGSFTYLPNPGYSGPDIFSYRAGDGTSAGGTTIGGVLPTNGGLPVPIPPEPVHDGAVAYVKIYVRPATTTVEAHNDHYATPQNAKLEVPTPGVLANDTGPTDHGLVATLVDQPGHGKLTLADDGGFTYTPDPDYVGEDHFVYRASDKTATPTTTAAGDGTFPGGSLAVVTIYVVPIDSPPKFIPGPSQNTTDESGPQKIFDWATLVAAGIGGKPANFIVTTDNSRLFQVAPAIDATGQLTYTPAPNVSGTATVTVVLAGEGESDSGSSEQFTINIDKPHPLSNVARACDVNDSGICTAADALNVIGYLNAWGSMSAAAVQSDPGRFLYLDVNKDGQITALDALLVIDDLNANLGVPAPEGEAVAQASDAPLLMLLAQDVADATMGRRRLM